MWTWSGRATGMLLTALVVTASHRAATQGSRARAAAATAAVLAEREVRTRDVAFFERRVRHDRWGATDRAQLAALHLAEARAGHPLELERAERLARESLQLRRGRNRAAALVLVSALMGQHRFAEALNEAQRLRDGDSTDPRLIGLMGEIELELGRYDAADRDFRRIGDGDLSQRMRLSRWRELHGELPAARRLLLQARDEARRAFGLGREQRAWFELRVAEFALRYGTTLEARAALDAGFALVPDDVRLRLAAARLSLLEHAWDDAAELAAQVLASSGDPSALALLARAEWGRGDSVAARTAIDALGLAAAAQPGSWHRDWTLALLDADRDVPALRARAERELATRRDVYGWDVVAWARHHDGDAAGAVEAMRHALALGTRDPLLQAHATAIGVPVER